MTWVIYNTKKFTLWCGAQYGAKHYATERAAKAQYTRLTKGLRAVLKEEDWKVASHAEFLALEPEVEVISLMSGKPCKIKASERGGCCDPSTERYWTM